MEKLPYKECENCKDWNGNIANCMVICHIPYRALKEFQQYRQIGTVDECRAAMEKQIPKEPIDDEFRSKCCPNCGRCACELLSNRHMPYCEYCGQALKWGD